MTASAKPRTARERARIELTSEIKEAARRQLAEHGAVALSLRTLAREVGLVSASALYRYFPGRDALLTALITDAYGALGDAAEAAEAQVRHEDVFTRWVAVCHAVRGWATASPHEYSLIYGTPVPGYDAPQDTIAPASRVPRLLGSLLGDLLTDGENPAEGPMHHALGPVLATMPPGVPDDLMIRGLMAWTYLFGAVSLEVFGHRNKVIGDHAAFFDHEISRLGALLGFTAPPS